jgi:prepilin-type N-terminal cleavage/methylation domain-containing protein
MKNRAFTLIELLIVVAIIAILAAIAVPNFLEAQTRAKVSRAKADMRAMATAVESYAVDANKYPFYHNALDPGFPSYNRTAPGSLAAERFEFRLPDRITTPVAYVTSLLNDPFPNLDTAEVTERTQHPFHYSNDQDYSANPGATPGSIDQYPVRFLFTQANAPGMPAGQYSNNSVVWYLMSHAPDTDHDSPDDGRPSTNYDPTNGTISNGDLYYWGPGTGIR